MILKSIVKVNILLKNIDDISSADKIYKIFFSGCLPARRTAGVDDNVEDVLILIYVVGNEEENTSIF